MKGNKVMTQERWQITILHPKTSKEFFHNIKFQKSVMKRRSSIKKLYLEISQYSQESTGVEVHF